MSENNNKKWSISAVDKPELEGGQWFPDNPAKPPTKWSFIVALLDEFAIIIFVIIVVYYIVVIN